MTDIILKLFNHDLDDYEGLTLSEMFERLEKEGVPDYAIFRPACSFTGTGAKFQYSKWKTVKDLEKKKVQ